MYTSNWQTLTLSALTAWFAVVPAATIPRPSGSALQTVYQFGNSSWLENIAIRSNGHILATDLVKGVIYDVDPNSNPVTPAIVATLPQDSIPAGITEVEPDVFYFNNGLGKASKFQFFANTSAIWKLDMNAYTKGGSAPAAKVVDIPSAIFLNGIVTVSRESGVILTSDSSSGTIYSVNVRQPSYQLALDHPVLKPNASSRPPVGGNGLRIRASKLYFANTDYGYLGTFPVSASGVITPTPSLITSSVLAADDFDIDRAGNVWLAENTRNTLVRVSPAGQVSVIAGGENSTALLGPVSTRFGRGPAQDTLYISTDGLSFDAKGVPVTNAGKIAKINTAYCSWKN